MAGAKQVLVVEDEPADIFLLRHAFAKSRVSVSLHFVQDGQEAIKYLTGEGVYADRKLHPIPDLILLDIKMPRVDGFEVLEWIRHQPGLRRLLVSMFSSSGLRTDVNRAYELGANSFLVKPNEPAKLADLVSRLEAYWLEINQTPDSLIE